MSYIIKKTNPFFSVKLTDIGRQKLASGQLNFSNWAIGDSEIDYGYMTPNNPEVNAKILKPKDRNPNIRFFLKNSNDEYLQPINNSNLGLLGITVNNEADERGFFSGYTDSPTTGWTVYTSTTYVTNTGFLGMNNFSGSSFIDFGLTGLSTCDFVLFAFTTPTLGDLTQNAVEEATPWLWYKVYGQTGTTTELDRVLPNLVDYFSGGTGNTVQYYIYTDCNDNNGCYTSGCTSSYWNNGTLSFDSSCNVSVSDVPVWCQNNVWCEELAGISANTYQGYIDFGSMDYIGQKNYLGYSCECNSAQTIDICTNTLSVEDSFNKSIGIIHYTNNTISNFYGEFFHIDTTTNKLLRIDLPTIMWHRRSGFSGSSTGTYMGMSFVSSGDVKTVETSDLEYYDLIEDPDMTIYPSSPLVVGRVYPQLKIVTIHDEELLASMSFKSNRNWTLPKLKASLSNPSTGIGTGVLEPNETMYLTYRLDSESGFTSSLPCQKYIKVINTSSTNMDVSFTLEDTGLLPYMRKVEDVGYDGRGFYAHNFKLLVQIVDDANCRPISTNWKEITWGGVSGETIDPLLLEDQNPNTNDFIVTEARYTGGTDFDLSYLGLPLINETDRLNFGDERFMFGNINTWIGAKIYKTVFGLTINGSNIVSTDNPTKDTATNLFISDIGIYDSEGNLVIIAKTSDPIELLPQDSVSIELTLDF